MKKLLFFLSKNKDLLLVFFILFFLSSPYLIDICTGYLNFGFFDTQYFLLWDYSLINHLVPYRDLIYPYGLLQYYKTSNVILSLLYYVIAPLNFTLIFYVLKKITKNKFILFTSIVSLYIFVFLFTGFLVFARYGVFIGFSLFLSSLLFLEEKPNYKLYFGIGFLLGLIYFLVNDQGSYLILSFILCFFINSMIKHKKSITSIRLSQYIIVSKKIIYTILGFIFGVLPLIFFLFKQNSFFDFFYYLKDLSNIVTVSKTPFFNFLLTSDNLFTVLTVYFSIFYIFIKILLFKNRKNLSIFLIIALIIDILILEQKSIIRSISSQITFISFLSLMIIFNDAIGSIKVHKIPATSKKVLYLMFIFTILLFFQFFKTDQIKYNINSIKENVVLLASNKCYEHNASFFLKTHESYLTIYERIKKYAGINAKVFSFPPGDSFFYILFRQIPPYYNSIWSASSKESQNKSLEYIKLNKVQYVFLNTDTSLTQDGVPDYIRAPITYKYLINNFHPSFQVGTHLILKKQEKFDFFNSNLLKSNQNYLDFLLSTNLYMIPYSEGLHKYKYFANAKPLLDKEKDSKQNLEINLYSKNMIIVLENDLNNERNIQTKLTIDTSGGLKTSISFNSCKKGEHCVINLSNIPLFYKNRNITLISLSKEFKGRVRIYENKKIYNLW